MAKIKIRNKRTGEERIIDSSEVGQYKLFPPLYGKKTEGEREKNRAIMSLRQEAMKGVTYKDLLVGYGDILDDEEIRREYNAARYYKEPAFETREEARGILEGKKAAPEVTVYERGVRGAIENMKVANEPLEEIYTMIRTRGFKPEDFADLLEGYSPAMEKRPGMRFFEGLFKQWPTGPRRA